MQLQGAKNGSGNKNWIAMNKNEWMIDLCSLKTLTGSYLESVCVTRTDCNVLELARATYKKFATMYATGNRLAWED